MSNGDWQHRKKDKRVYPKIKIRVDDIKLSFKGMDNRMSWGERSCAKQGCKIATYESCNVNCPEYVHDGHTRPDSPKTETYKERLRKKIIRQLKIG